MIPSPNLDDRTFEDIVEEAKRLIPQYCPEWTNFNPSDPGITLIELFAWMTEMMLYRLNKVPDKNYLAFLDLMGVRLRPPQPARALLRFEISDAVDHLTIPRGTPFATKASAGAKSLNFETDEEVNLVNNELRRVVCQYHDAATQRLLIADVTDEARQGAPGGFEPFVGTREVARYLYLGDARLANFSENAVLTLMFRRSDASRDAEQELREFARLLEWEYFNGEQWKELGESTLDAGPGGVAFYGPPAIAPCEVGGIQGFWIRGRLVEVPRSPLETELDTVTAQLEVIGEGEAPDRALVQVPDSGLFLECDLDRNFLPFQKTPGIDSTFYLSSRSVLSRPDTMVRIEFQLSDTTAAPPPAASEDLVLRWQYWNGKKWMDIGRTTPGGVVEKGRRFSFEDSTSAFTRSGVVQFFRPPDLAAGEVDQHENFWIRARIEVGNFGVEGSYINIDDRWVYEKGNLAPPSLVSVVFKSSEDPRALEHVVAFNDWSYQEYTAQAKLESKPFQTFAPIPDENPSMFLGFAEPFPNLVTQIYFRATDEGAGATRSGQVGAGQVGAGQVGGRAADEDGASALGQNVVWEYWNGRDWHPLMPRDHTSNFTASGMVQFLGPKDLRPTRRFGDELYWIRARLEMGGYDVPPRLQQVITNTVYASHITTFRNAVLGTSQGTPNQFFRFVRGPVLSGQQIAVREPEVPPGPELDEMIADLGEDAIRPDPERAGHCVVIYKEVDSLYESGPRSRHYLKDIVKGEIRFGDGVHGFIPPKGDRNVLALRYQVGGGDEGNVAADTITVTKHSIGYLESVTNAFPATGGCALETVDEVKLRGPHMLKSRNRAVTAEDFEWLAIEASNSVARVKALPSLREAGEVVIVVVPRLPKGPSGSIALLDKPLPSQELLARVRRYLDERRLLTTVLRVVKPRYVDLKVEIRVVRTPSGSSDRIKREIEHNLRRFLHPLVGGRNGKGWPFGRPVYKADLYHVVEEVAGVEFVDAVRLVDAERRREVDQLRLGADELVFLTAVEVTEVAQERIV